MRLVIVESPYAATEACTVEDNVRYARRCLADALHRGEAPLASHLLYTQVGVLDDTDPDERTLGISAGLAWGEQADATVVYIDHGISSGMELGIVRAQAAGRPVEYRALARQGLSADGALPRRVEGR